jgi:hypothetical protein
VITYEVDDRISFPLSVLRDIIPSPQLIMPVEIPCKYHLKSCAGPAPCLLDELRRMDCIQLQVARYKLGSPASYKAPTITFPLHGFAQGSQLLGFGFQPRQNLHPYPIRSLLLKPNSTAKSKTLHSPIRPTCASVLLGYTDSVTVAAIVHLALGFEALRDT